MEFLVSYYYLRLPIHQCHCCNQIFINFRYFIAFHKFFIFKAESSQNTNSLLVFFIMEFVNLYFLTIFYFDYFAIQRLNFFLSLIFYFLMNTIKDLSMKYGHASKYDY